MEQTISFTLGDLYGFVLGVCGLIAALAAAVAVVAKLIQKWKAPNKKQNEEISELKSRVTNIEERLDEGDKMFKDDRKQAEELEAKLMEDRFDLNDFLEQMEKVSKMGSMKQILGMLPGVNASALENAEIDE